MTNSLRTRPPRHRGLVGRRAGAAALAVIVAITGFSIPSLPNVGAGAAPSSDVIDSVRFGDSASEGEHAFATDGSRASGGALEQPTRVAVPLEPASTRLGDLTVTLAVHPAEQNHVTLQFWGEDDSAYKTHLLVNGEQLGYRNSGDHQAINVGTRGGLPGRFFYATALLPLSVTQGAESVRLTVRTAPATAGAAATEESRGYYQAFTHVQPSFEPAATGTRPDAGSAPALAPAEQQAMIDSYRAAQVKRFDTLGAKVDASPTGVLNINKYANELRYYAETIDAEWSPADTPELKRAALDRIFATIDRYTKAYYGDVKSLGSGGHQSDWGGFYSELGEALYIVENLIEDDDVMGRDAFDDFLAQPFTTGTSDGTNSLAGVDWNGGELSRAEAWERVLKANFDFARSRLSYISNQVHYTYEGAWKAHEGLGVIGSEFYEGKDRSHEIIREIWGISPFLGEEVLVGPNGEELDVTHSLFLHDRTAQYTDDYLRVIMRGLAQSKTDKKGDVVRRLPYGEHYTSLTEDGLLRENRYVGSYGETANWLPTYFFRTWGHEGDEKLNAQLLQKTLESLHARSLTRYQGVDPQGNRIMYMEQVVDERNAAYPGKVAYSTESARNAALLYAALEQHMAANPTLYAGKKWDRYWQYAREAVGFAQQQLVDNQYFPFFQSGSIANINNDHRLPETWEYVTGGRADVERFGATAAGVVFPNSDLDLYTDAELATLGVDRDALDTPSAWVDLDNLFVRIADGDTTILGSLAMRNYGYTANGRLHVMTDGFEHDVQVKTQGLFDYRDYTVRPDSFENPIIVDQEEGGALSRLAWAGELAPVTYQKGVGVVDRDNYVVDTPYSAYPDVITTTYGDYFVAMNTTRSKYGNKKTHTIDVPDAFSGSVRDLVSGKKISVKKGEITLKPGVSVVLVADGADRVHGTPDRVDIVVATPGADSVGLTWRAAAGAESYDIWRANKKGKLRVVAEDVVGSSYLDTDLDAGSYRYAVTANGSEGTSAASTPVSTSTVGTPLADGWAESAIGDIGDADASLVDGRLTLTASEADGFGSGDDFVIDERWAEDSLAAVTRPIEGDATLSALLEEGSGDVSALSVRDSLESTARYVALGANADGGLELRVRTLDSRVNIEGLAGRTGVQGATVSPRTLDLEDYSSADYPYLRLQRNADAQQIVASVSADGLSWTAVARVSFPAVSVVHAGLVTDGTVSVSDLTVAEREASAVQPWVSAADETVSLGWDKTKDVATSSVFRTRDADVALTDPLEADGWDTIADHVLVTGINEDIVGADAFYRVVTFDVSGQPIATSESVSASGYPLADLIAEARVIDTATYTETSVEAFLTEVDAVEEAARVDGADQQALAERLADAYAILVPVYRSSFEGDDVTSLWKAGGSAPASYTRTVDTTPGTARTGDGSLLFTSSDTSGNAGYNLWFASQTATEPRIAAAPSTTYRVSFWYQLDDYVPGRTVGAYVFLRGFSGATGVGAEQRSWLASGDTPAGEWVKVEKTFTTGSATIDSLQVSLGLRGSSGSFRVDDLVVEPLPAS